MNTMFDESSLSDEYLHDAAEHTIFIVQWIVTFSLEIARTLGVNIIILSSRHIGLKENERTFTDVPTDSTVTSAR